MEGHALLKLNSPGEIVISIVPEINIQKRPLLA
jgi:hypothetical protein